MASREAAMPARRAEIAAWRRGQIIDAAMVVFGRAGVDAASMKQVAAQAQVTPGLLYHYFGSKEALVLAVIAERGFLPELRRLLIENGYRPAREVLPEIFREFGQFVRRRADLVGVFVGSAQASPQIRQGKAAVVAEGLRLLADYLDTRVAAGELRAHDTRASAQLVMTSCAFGHLMGNPVDPAAVIDVLINGLAPRAAMSRETTESRDR